MTGIAPSLKKYLNEIAVRASFMGQKFLVLRNYQKLPEVNVGHDIDILIPHDKIELWYAIFKEAYVKMGLVSVSPKIINFCCHKQYIQGLNIGELEVDIEPHLNWRGVDWIGTDVVIKRALLFKDNIWIPHPADECVISFCMSYLYGGFVQEKYLAIMSEQAIDNKNEVLKLMSNIFGKKIAAKIVNSLICKDVYGIAKKATKYRILVLLRGFIKHPLTFIYTFIFGYYLEYKAKRKEKM